MTLFVPDVSTMDRNEVLLECPLCKWQTVWRSISKADLLNLVKTTQVHKLSEELGYLRKARDLLDRFPGTQNPIFKPHASPSASSLACDESLLSQQLEHDPDLKKFLQNRLFNLTERLVFVKQYVERNPLPRSADSILCENCDHYLVLADDYFFQGVDDEPWFG